MMKYLLSFAVAFVLAASTPAQAQNAFSDPGTGEMPAGSSGTLAAVDPKVDAGEIDPGTNNSMIAQFRNESPVDIEFKDVKLFPSSNVTAQIVSDQCSSEPLLSGAQCAIVMEVKGLQSGAFRVEVLARHSGRSRLVTATISGTVKTSELGSVKASDVEITPAIVDFGKLEASRPIIRSVTLRNITSNPITVNDVFIDAPEASGFTLNENCGELAAGASCIASITWSPVTKGPTSGALVVQHTGATGVATANLTGDFVPSQTEAAKAFPEAVPGKGLLVASEEEIQFGTDIQSQSSISVSLVNIGDAPLSLEKMELSGSEQGLKLIHEGCTEGLVLAPTEACPLTISWSPSKSGTVIDDVKITHTGARGVLVLPIRGTSVAAVNVDSKPVVTVVETTVTENGKTTTIATPSSAQEDSSPPVLDGYSVTSLATRNAVISGPGGSRMVRAGSKVRLGGHTWDVSVSEEGVIMSSGRNKVLLVFDRSLAAPVAVGPASDAEAGKASATTPQSGSTYNTGNVAAGQSDTASGSTTSSGTSSSGTSSGTTTSQ